MVQAIFEELGYKAIPAGMPGEALRQTESQAKEMMLLITDVVMPEMNGRELEQLHGKECRKFNVFSTRGRIRYDCSPGWAGRRGPLSPDNRFP